VLALSCYLWNVISLMEVAAEVKRALPNLIVVAGGPEVGPIPERTLRAYPALDVVVMSEGERPLAALVNCWRAGASIDDVAGIWRRDGERLVGHADAPIVDLDSLPSPHQRGYVNHSGRFACFETQRGCVFRCSFCFYNKGLSIRNRRFDMARVEEDLRFWLSQDIRELYFMDPVFNLNATRAKEICRIIAAHNHRRIPISAEVWAEFIDDEMAGLMKAAGFSYLEVGLQSTEPSTLETVDRRLRAQPFQDGVRHLRNHGIVSEVQLILGLPGDTLASFKASINFAAAQETDHLVTYRLMVLPGTELWSSAEQLGLVYQPAPPYRIISTATMPPEELALGWEMGCAVPLLWRSQTFRWLSREPGMTFADLLEAWARWVKARPGDGLADGPDRPVIHERNAAALTQFVDAHCEKHGIAPDFYRAAARREFKH
jgi:anaerobic magnesium-protoporphyrin IX monomethyl ester cyclase